MERAEEQARRLVELEQRLWFADLPDPLGYRHAVWSARPLIEDEPFLLLLGDHLDMSSEPRRFGRQLLDLAAAEDCAVSAVGATREHLIHRYGTLPGMRLSDRPDVYAIEEIKDVKDGGGHGQEDVFPVAQFEKLRGDQTSLPDLPRVLAVDGARGHQLKDATRLGGWANDGDAASVGSPREFSL